MSAEVYYRYDTGCATVNFDLLGDGAGMPMVYSLMLTEYEVEKHTPRGVKLRYSGRFIANSWRKKFAHPTKAEALDAFRHRKRKQIAILRDKLAEAEGGLAAAEGKTPETITLDQGFTTFEVDV